MVVSKVVRQSVNVSKKKGKNAFPSFDKLAEEVRYHAERTNIPQIQQGLGTTGSTTPSRNKPLGRKSDHTWSSNVALTSASPPVDNSEPTPLCEESLVAATQAQQPSCTTSPTSSSPNAQKTTPPDSSTYCFYHKMKSHATNGCEQFQKLSYEEHRDFLMRNKMCSKDLKDLNARHDVLPVQRSLGTYWCIETDTIGFHIELKDKPLTHRGILSTMSSVYDPLGIVAPVISVGKQLLQELCHDNMEWDDPVPSHVHSQREKWRSKLPLLEKITIARCVKPPSFGEPVVTELHSFSDASDVGLGQVTYLPLVNNLNQVHVSFLMGKAIVAPLKPIGTLCMDDVAS